MKKKSSLPSVNMGVFVGRSSELDYLSMLFSQNNIVLLSGMGGVGKTTIARMFVELNKNNYENVIWSSFYEFSDPNEDLSNVIKNLNRENDKGIIVIDDIDKKGLEQLSSLSASINKNWHVILVSRYTSDTLLIPSITIGGLSKFEARELVKKRIPQHHEEILSEFESNRLLDFVKNHPLSIILILNAYEKYSSLSISEFLEHIARSQEFTFDIAKKPVEIYLDTDNEEQKTL